VVDDANGGDTMVGAGTSKFSLDSYCGSDDESWGWYGSGTKYTNGASTPYAPTYMNDGDVCGIALDLDNGKIWFSLNGVWTGDPAAGTGEAFSGLSGTLFAAVSLYNASKILSAQFASGDLTHAAPAGFTSGLYS